MELTINGDRQRLPDGITVTQLLLERTHTLEGVAVAVDGEIVHRAGWASCTLADGQAVELITALQGG
jgi:sulfur carrier protein